MSAEDLLSSIANLSDETEFYTPMPAGYRKGQAKYVIVLGTVMSGLGKGIFSSSLAKVLKDKGFTVAPIKLEGYLNRDSGTLNPYRHGEVFVLDDGMECDMDLGTYERMLNQDLTRLNFATSGQIFARVLEKERRGGYLGRDVQMIPHVTGEVKSRLRELAVASGADVVFVEIGGTVGDVENEYFIEAARELAFEEGPNSCCFVALTYIVHPPTLGEQKSKPAQLNIKRLMSSGIQPHIIGCRAHEPVNKKVREKLALHSNVPMERVFSMHDCDSVYVIPEMLRGAGIDAAVLDILQLSERVNREAEERGRRTWSDYITRFREAKHPITIGITGKYTSLRDSYASVIHALEHSGTKLGARVQLEWIDSSELTEQNVAEKLRHVHGVIVPGGFGVRGVEGKITCVKYARENRLPYLGLCYGMQIAVIEYARNVCGLEGANSTEIDADSAYPVIDILPEQKKIEGLGGSMRLGGHDVVVTPGTLLSRMYGLPLPLGEGRGEGSRGERGLHLRAEEGRSEGGLPLSAAAEEGRGEGHTIRLRFRHRYEVDPQFIGKLEAAGIIFSGRARNVPIMQVMELAESQHPYFVCTQAHAELTSRPLNPSPMFVGLVRAAMIRSGVDPATVPDFVIPSSENLRAAPASV